MNAIKGDASRHKPTNVRKRLMITLTSILLVATASACVGQGTWPNASFGDGGVPPGLYRTIGGSACYWERLRNFSGDLNSIIANEFSSWEPQWVEVKPSDAGFKTSGCVTWWMYPQYPKAIPLATPGQPFGPGMFMIGYEISPGRYVASGQGCYWARLRDFSGEIGSLITNDFVNGQTIVDIAPTDVGFTSSNCGTWTKIG